MHVDPLIHLKDLPKRLRGFDRGRSIRTRSALICVLGCLFFLATSGLAAPRIPPSAGQNAAPAKENPPDLKPFVGTWKASFNGDVFAILVLREDRCGLSGTLNNFDIGVDKDGNLNDNTHKDQGDAPLLNTRFKSGALWFVVMQKDQYAPSTEWKFIPKSPDEGELTPVLDRQVNAPKDMIVKPIRMVREHAQP
jgi:hypothetical protein